MAFRDHRWLSRQHWGSFLQQQSSYLTPIFNWFNHLHPIETLYPSLKNLPKPENGLDQVSLKMQSGLLDWECVEQLLIISTPCVQFLDQLVFKKDSLCHTRTPSLLLGKSMDLAACCQVSLPASCAHNFLGLSFSSIRPEDNSCTSYTL